MYAHALAHTYTPRPTLTVILAWTSALVFSVCGATGKTKKNYAARLPLTRNNRDIEYLLADIYSSAVTLNTTFSSHPTRNKHHGLVGKKE